MSELFLSHLSRYKCDFDGQHCPNRSTDPDSCGGAHSNSSCDGEAKERQRLPFPSDEVQ